MAIKLQYTREPKLRFVPIPVRRLPVGPEGRLRTLFRKEQSLAVTINRATGTVYLFNGISFWSAHV